MLAAASCQGVRLPQLCSNRGYQDPKNCSSCRCPSGWSGRFCEQVAPPVNAVCGGLLTATSLPSSISFPSPSGSTPYTSWQECSWLIEVSQRRYAESKREVWLLIEYLDVVHVDNG